MTTSDRPVFVWIWLPGGTDAVVAGRLDADPGSGEIGFTYGRGYLNNSDAVSIFAPELPLVAGRIAPKHGLAIASCIRDAAPDAWGRRVILARRLGHVDRDTDTDQLGILTYLLESGSNRIGALDFQTSPANCVAREDTAALDQLHAAARTLDEGGELSKPLAQALVRGSSIGGARPKALIRDGSREYIAKFSSATDFYPVVKAEALGLELARRVGINTPASRVVQSNGRDVLLVERFDRVSHHRRMVVSGLTMLGLDEMAARYASYPELGDVLRSAGAEDPHHAMRELFGRIVFNVAIGNNDDHARNISAFWDGRALTLTPAYDLCPQPRSGETSTQAMAISSGGAAESSFRVCWEAAPDYLLDRSEAAEIIDHQIEVIHSEWTAAADAAGLTHVERAQLWGRQVISPLAIRDW